MQPLWDLFAKNKDAITTILAVLGTLGAIAGVIWALFKWGILRWWQNRVRIDVKVFEVVSDPNVLLPKLYSTENDDSPLADHRITYQPRDPKRDIQTELKAALSRSRYLLITAPTGYGKTREGGVLAQTMMLEGWRVLRIKSGWLDIPKTLPEELGGNRSRVLVFLDDLNGLFSTGNLTESPRAEKMPLLLQSSYHDRLLQVLDMLEGMCSENEVRIIATARSEADQWRLLDFDEKDKLWKRYERIELPEPVDSAIVDLLDSAVKQANLEANPDDFESIAHKSDGTYRNILLNLRRWRTQNKEVNKDDLTETLDGSWRDIYERAVKKHTAVKYIYDAIDVLQQAGIELLPFLVEPTAVMIWGGTGYQKWQRGGKIARALKYLSKETRILRKANSELAPSDGQIEAKQRETSWTIYLDSLTTLLLNSSNDKMVMSSLFGLATACYFQNKIEHSYTLIKKYIGLNANDTDAHNNLGVLLNNQKRYDEAEAAYRKAIELNPMYTNAYYNLGNTLHDLKRYDEAEAAYRKAIEIDPMYTSAYYNLGGLLKDLKRYDEAEVVYRKAIELNASDVDIYRRLINLLRFELSYRMEETLPLLEKVIEINPEDFNSYLGIVSIKKKLGESVETLLVEKARQYIPEDDFYNRACLESVCDDFDLAFEHLKRAAEVDEFDSAWAWEDPDLQWIRDNPRFTEIVGPKPENKNSEI